MNESNFGTTGTTGNFTANSFTGFTGSFPMARAKFECVSAKQTTWAWEYEFNAVVGGSPENESFFNTTPSGNLKITIKNDNLHFEVGKKYFLDFTIEPIKLPA
jgi:hypothetical protein